MSIDFSKVTAITTPSGSLSNIKRTSDLVQLWPYVQGDITGSISSSNWEWKTNTELGQYGLAINGTLQSLRAKGYTKFKLWVPKQTLNNVAKLSDTTMDQLPSITWGFEEGIGGSTAATDIRVYPVSNDFIFANVDQYENSDGTYTINIPEHTGSVWSTLDTDTSNQIFGFMFSHVNDSGKQNVSYNFVTNLLQKITVNYIFSV